MSQFELKLQPYLDMKLRLSEEDCGKLGKKDPEAYPLHVCVCVCVRVCVRECACLVQVRGCGVGEWCVWAGVVTCCEVPVTCLTGPPLVQQIQTHVSLCYVVA